MERKIPITNIYYMLSYAWDVLKEKDIVNVDIPDNYSMIELLAKVLNAGTNYLIRKGIDRGYVEQDGEVDGIKGKIDFKQSLTRLSFQNAKSVCIYDDFTHNVLHNKILKSTFWKLTRSQLLERELRNEIFKTYKIFDSVEFVQVNRKLIKSVKLHRNNYLYKLLLNICLLITENLSIDESTGKAQFKDFTEDDKQMAELFESFVRNFYKKKLPGIYPKEEVRVDRETIYWDVDESKGFDSIARQILPQMHTDISIWIGNRKIIMDTKYYRQAIKHGQYGEKLSSANLYQLFSYLQNAESRSEADKNAEGILLYSEVQRSIDAEYHIKGHKMGVKTVNLGMEKWSLVEDKLLSIIKLLDTNQSTLS